MSTKKAEKPEVLEGELVETDERGRPTKMTPELVTKLMAAFSNHFNVGEACSYAGISRNTYYRWLEEKPDFSDKMEQAQSMPLRRAKEVLIKGINEGEDAHLALRFLERRDPDFRPTAKIEHDHRILETRRKLKELIENDNEAKDDGGAKPPAAAESGGDSEVADHNESVS